MCQFLSESVAYDTSRRAHTCELQFWQILQLFGIYYSLISYCREQFVFLWITDGRVHSRGWGIAVANFAVIDYIILAIHILKP